MKLEKDDFDTWLASPVTQFVLKEIGLIGDEAKAEWERVSWAGHVDPLDQRYLKGRADLAEALSELTVETLEDMNDGDEAKE